MAICSLSESCAGVGAPTLCAAFDQSRSASPITTSGHQLPSWIKKAYLMHLHFCITASLLLGCIHAQNGQAASLWEHNGSTVSLVADGENRQFSYEEPRPGMVDAGAHLGSVLFTGKSLNGSYVGTAYIFNAHCGQIPYQVSGPILARHERVVLKGQAPRLDSDCNIVGYV